MDCTGSCSGSGCVPPAAKSCSLYEAPGLRPCVSKVSPSPCFRFGAGIFCFAPGGRWDCVRRAPRPAGSFSRTATPHGGWGSGSFAALFGGVFLPSPGCGALLLRRGTWPACKKQTAFLLRLANFPGGRRSALVKIGALRQRRLPISSTGRGRRRCPCSASLHLPQAALRLHSHPPTEAPPWLRHRPHTGALNHRLLLLVAGCLQPQSLSLTESAQPPGRGAVKNSEPRQGRGRRPGQTQRPHPVDETGSCCWLRS